MEGNTPAELLGILGAVIFAVSVVLIRFCITSTANSQARSSATAAQSDHRIVFDGMSQPQPLRNIPRLNATTSPTQIVQELEEQLHFDNMRIEYERRAQERRDTLGRSNYAMHMPPRLGTNTGQSPPETSENSFSYSNPAPRYISQDEELPSYEAAIATASNNR